MKFDRVRGEVELNDGSIVHAYLNPTSPLVGTPEAGIGASCEVYNFRQAFPCRYLKRIMVYSLVLWFPFWDLNCKLVDSNTLTSSSL